MTVDRGETGGVALTVAARVGADQDLCAGVVFDEEVPVVVGVADELHVDGLARRAVAVGVGGEDDAPGPGGRVLVAADRGSGCPVP